jgi:hypothetical protein
MIRKSVESVIHEQSGPRLIDPGGSEQSPIGNAFRFANKNPMVGPNDKRLCGGRDASLMEGNPECGEETRQEEDKREPIGKDGPKGVTFPLSVFKSPTASQVIGLPQTRIGDFQAPYRSADNSDAAS